MEQLHFKTNVQIKSIIGKDLINDDNIAILELVKNSFDADAKRVDISFQNLKENDDNEVKEYSSKTSRLILSDDGVGMNIVDIRDKWLNIAYSEKKTNTRQYNRLMAGAKGVGRFSCDRLGKYLNLYAKKRNEGSYIVLSIDWKQFEIINKDAEIQSVALIYDTISAAELTKRGIPAFDHGVVLEIIKLRTNWVALDGSEWNTEKLSNLKKYLEKLINPNQAFEKNDFGIFLNAPEFVKDEGTDRFLGKIENTIFQKLDFKTTSIECKTIGNGAQILTTLKDKGEIIYWIKETSDFFPTIKDFKITLYFLNTYAKAFFTKQTGIRSVDYGSIFLFLNGFRIPPYGELGDDWLKLDQRRAQGYARFISARDLVGQIEILDADETFQIVSSREGLVKNSSYEILTDRKTGLFYRVLKRLEKYVVDGLNWDSIPEEDKNRISEIEKKIISGELVEKDLKYQEDSATKRRRIYESIHSIISAVPQKVIELYINEDLIESKIAEEKALAEQEFSQLLSDFENKKVSGELLAQILRKKAAESEDLEKQLAAFAKYTTNEATSKAIAELQVYKQTVEKQTHIIEQLQAQLNEKENAVKEAERKAEEERQNAEEARRRAQEEQEKREKIQKELDLKTKQNLFLLSVGSLDTDRILKYHHDIRIHTATIHNTIGQILRKAHNGTLTNEQTTKLVERISRANDKITSIAQFATKANYSTDADVITADFVSYVSEYINHVLPEFYSELTLNCVTNDCAKILEFAPLEASIFIDNLISNTTKFNARHFDVTFENKDNAICMTITDDGAGMDPKISSEENIFEKGYTTTNGSGLGLYNVATFVKNVLKGTIAVERKQNQRGFKLIIKF